MKVKRRKSMMNGEQGLTVVENRGEMEDKKCITAKESSGVEGALRDRRRKLRRKLR